jgi:hypothetical protein
MLRYLLLPLIAAATIATSDAATAGEAEQIAVGDVVVPTPAPGLDPQTLKSAAASEIEQIDPKLLHSKKRYVVSLTVIRASDGPVSCEVTAILAEKKSGSMLAILQGRARAEGGGNPELRRAVLRAAVRTAVRQIPEAINAK